MRLLHYTNQPLTRLPRWRNIGAYLREQARRAEVWPLEGP